MMTIFDQVPLLEVACLLGFVSSLELDESPDKPESQKHMRLLRVQKDIYLSLTKV